uniref:Neutral zinc metallopeptidase n=1 Tax=Globisporangium ultimum (strain ATCC 200006 / CBS 805.95 / DAOM BR144) TaxID=431595 RepID=K3X0Y6_GLOUD
RSSALIALTAAVLLCGAWLPLAVAVPEISFASSDDSYAPGTVRPAGLSRAAASSDVVAATVTASKSSDSKSVHSYSPSSGGSNSSASKCGTGEPTTGYISDAYADWIWENRMHKEFRNFSTSIFDQLLTANGTLSYCVRWDSPRNLSKTTASKFKAMLERQYAQWNKWLVGYGCWPIQTISIDVVGVAVNSTAQLDWTDDSLGSIYVGELDTDGVITCPDACYKHRDGFKSADMSGCKGTPFDIMLWPTLDQGGGVGGDWGQRVDEKAMLATLDANTSVIVAHEIGHGFGLPDFYQPSEKPGADMPNLIMEAGKTKSVTEGDGVLMRRGWDYVRKHRYPEFV